jgi:hypothetical protein
MGSVNLVVIVESARTIITKSDDELQKFHLPSIIAVSAALGAHWRSLQTTRAHHHWFQLSNSFCLYIVILYAASPAKYASFGKITGTIYG